VRFEDIAKDVDVVYDTMGGDTQERSWKVVKKGGILVSIVSPPSKDVAAAHGVRAEYVFVQPNTQELAEIARLVDFGELKPIVETVLPLTEARQAQELNKKGHTRGKIVLKVRG